MNKNNYYISTVVDFIKVNRKLVNRKSITKYKPDYVSYSGSRYWYTQNGVYRLSNHWGDVGECVWTLNQKFKKSHKSVLGYARFKEFKKCVDVYSIENKYPLPKDTEINNLRLNIVGNILEFSPVKKIHGCLHLHGDMDIPTLIHTDIVTPSGYDTGYTKNVVLDFPKTEYIDVFHISNQLSDKDYLKQINIIFEKADDVSYIGFELHWIKDEAIKWEIDDILYYNGYRYDNFYFKKID